MKNKIIKITCLTFSILFILISPLNTYIDSYNIYAVEATISAELKKQTIIPLLISAGLVFRTKEAAEQTYYKVEDWLYDQGFNFEFPKDPKEPNGPKLKLGDVLLGLGGGKVIYDAALGQYKKIIEIPNGFFKLIKDWVDLNFNVGENIILPEGVYYCNEISNTYLNYPSGFDRLIFYGKNFEIIGYLRYKYGYYQFLDSKGKEQMAKFYDAPYITYDLPFKELYFQSSPDSHSNVVIQNVIYVGYINISTDNLQSIIGFANIVGNPNYDWNNPFTNNKIITLPIETDSEGKPEVDSDGFHKPSVDSEYWVNKEPFEITQDDPSGIPEPDEDENYQTGILNYLKNFLNYFKKISTDVNKIKQNTDTLTNGNGNGNGNDTEVPTGFEWGDFKRFFDVIYIFIYFIVILILLLVKFLQVVFLNLTNIPANAELFNQYPTILSGVNFVKNLKVGGLNITVHQAFEYVFMIFFFIFIIKQIRKLYGAYVYEENERIGQSIRDHRSERNRENDAMLNDIYENINKR